MNKLPLEQLDIIIKNFASEYIKHNNVNETGDQVLADPEFLSILKYTGWTLPEYQSVHAKQSQERLQEFFGDRVDQLLAKKIPIELILIMFDNKFI